MPEQLLGRVIRACSNEGDLVLDPFTGSGTTLVAAKKLGREYAGVEVSEEYAKYARKRLRLAKVGDPLDGAEKPLTSAPATRSKRARMRNDMVLSPEGRLSRIGHVGGGLCRPAE